MEEDTERRRRSDGTHDDTTHDAAGHDESLQVPQDEARGQAATWGRIPRTYIRHTRDVCIPPALQDRMIAEADRLTPRNRFDVRSVPATHMADAAGWAASVEIVDELATAVTR